MKFPSGYKHTHRNLKKLINVGKYYQVIDQLRSCFPNNRFVQSQLDILEQKFLANRANVLAGNQVPIANVNGVKNGLSILLVTIKAKYWRWIFVKNLKWIGFTAAIAGAVFYYKNYFQPSPDVDVSKPKPPIKSKPKPPIESRPEPPKKPKKPNVIKETSPPVVSIPDKLASKDYTKGNRVCLESFEDYEKALKLVNKLSRTSIEEFIKENRVLTYRVIISGFETKEAAEAEARYWDSNGYKGAFSPND